MYRTDEQLTPTAKAVLAVVNIIGINVSMFPFFLELEKYLNTSMWFLSRSTTVTIIHKVIVEFRRPADGRRSSKYNCFIFKCFVYIQ